MSKERNSASKQISLEPDNNQRLALLCGQFDENLKLIERRTGARLGYRGNIFKIQGENDEVVQSVAELLKHLYRETEAGNAIPPDTV
ncbi:MAG: PhoH family protein, partial [Oleiphilaceae bacterium]|nr:PhoH family protein [Oleiphilaceae bacterium]